tara:strand:- start:39 stop:260 length:222 start_codon:yes stop_codon:yes gene_type:complete
MKLSNNKFKELLFSTEPTKYTNGLVMAESDDVYIVYNFRDDVLDPEYFKIYNENYVPTDEQIEITKEYLNQFT